MSVWNYWKQDKSLHKIKHWFYKFLNPVYMQLYLIHWYFIELQILRFFCPDSARKNARAVFILWCIEYCLSSDKTTNDWCKQFKTFIHDIVTSHRFCVHSNLTVEYINGHKTCGLWWWFISAKAISILPHIYEVWIEMVFTKKQKHHINYLFRIIFDLRRFL